jgi:hypothetical protein
MWMRCRIDARGGAEMRSAPGFKDQIIEDLEIAGIDNLADSAVILRCRFKVYPLEQWDVKREFSTASRKPSMRQA